ncbi:inorganic phosphate transporter [Maribacter polysiphoniae]|uniref:Phosphate transporter n=2 Tax=Maribacter polysiphoniae TaxID=429344 RepID=A0ABR7VV47_9FLAO|nr:inorganic phosphate transporter [Maribacter polysiphoniae]MBD1259864.1 inorganic phosphate transporter [Maribacter polysiphoniae]
MDNIYLLMIIALAFLAVADLVVGVSNDAVNFLNSAIGSKAISFKTIMIVASVGIALGAIFSSGMMEVARKGIFNPSEFMFNEIMFIFMAVMITDILLLDFFNTLGMPTSTTVSIVFELLGAAVAMSMIKIWDSGGDYTNVLDYINTSKALEIILGILLSVVVAFTVGAMVQWISRLLLSYNFEKKAKWVGALFGGIALSAITYFILMKGIKGTTYASQSFDLIGGMTISDFLEQKVWFLILVNFTIWSILSFFLMTLAKVNIYKLIIGVGTFALALAFAGNDLVNFIGVPIAAFQSYEAWSASGVAATEFSMAILANKVPTPTLLLFISGMIMVATLWFSKKARHVADTEINLSREGASNERFEPNVLSRGIVRLSILMSQLTLIFPKSVRKKVDARFKKPVIHLSKDKSYELPAFDMVRAAVNLMVAGILISIATSYKLPLSTTYVTFMVAMGTSLADRAWGPESAVYRVAGVLNVIGGWFGTAIIAFVASGAILTIISFGKGAALAVLLFAAILLLIRSYISYNKKSKEIKAEDSLRKAESSSIQGVIEESVHNIANVIKRTNKIYTNSINGLARQDLDQLKKGKKQVYKLSKEIDELRDNIFYFIKNLDETSIGASNFYITILGNLTDIAQSLDYIAKICHKHVNNNHSKLKYNQIKELKQIDQELETLFNNTKEAFDNRSFERMGILLQNKQNLFDMVTEKIQKQVARTRTEESSPKNTTLYFSLLLETKDLLKSTISLMESYYNEHDSSVKPARLDE